MLRPAHLLACEQKCEDRFAKSKLVHSIMRHVAETTGCNLEQLYTEVRRVGEGGGEYGCCGLQAARQLLRWLWVPSGQTCCSLQRTSS